jgi:hypothetical protein
VAVLPPPSLRAPIRPVCRRQGCGDDAFYPTGFCFACGVHYINWRAARDRLEALDLAVGGHPPHAELDDDPAFAAVLDLLYLHLFRGPFE